MIVREDTKKVTPRQALERNMMAVISTLSGGISGIAYSHSLVSASDEDAIRELKNRAYIMRLGASKIEELVSQLQTKE